MDSSQFFDLIKNIYNVLKCPSCGEVYEINEIQFLGHFDGLLLMQLNCKKCKLPVSVNFYAADKATTTKRKFIEKMEDYSQKDPVSTDEVILFHKSLKKFEGNFKKLVRTLNK